MTKRIVSLLCAFCIVLTSVFCGNTFTAGAAEPTQENYYEVSDEWTSISCMTVSGNTLRSDIDSGWAKAVNQTSVAADKNFIFETGVSYVSGSNHQYFVYFGLPANSDTTGGFSLRIQLGDTAGTSNIAVYNDATNKRVSAWRAMPESSDRANFRLKMSYIDGKLTVRVDETDVIETTLSGYQGGYLGIATFKTKAEFQGLTLRMEKEQDVTKVYLANEDFSSFKVDEHGTAVNGNLSVISSESTRAAILTEDGNKYLSMSRSGAQKAKNCLLQFQDQRLTEDTYVIQFDARLDENVPLLGKANLLVGRKATASGAKFEYFVNVSQAGYLYCTTGALGSTTFGRLGNDRFSNIAVVIHDGARTYDVYLDGLPAVMGQGFTNSGYAGVPSDTPTLYRIALGELTTDSALLIDNFKVYTGSQVDDCKETDKTIIQQFDHDFEKRSYIDSRGTKLNYRMYLPDDYDPAKKYPLVLAMHGAGLWGSDDTSQLMNCFHLGISLWQNRDKYGESIILVPQTAEKVSWVTGNGAYPWFEEDSHNYSMEDFEISQYLSAVVELLDNVVSSYSVDETRQYVGGFSMGGYATWYLITAYPNRFAAAVPCCGGSDPAYAKYIKDVPIWTFHSTDDATVKVEATREMVSALQALGSSVKYTEFTNLGHNVWDYAFQSDQVLDWMFAQKNETVSNWCTLQENIVWKPYSPEWMTLTTNWKQENGRYQATGSGSWNKVVLDQKLDQGSFRFETVVSDFLGDQLYMYFGLPDNASTDNGYSLRFQMGESAGANNICIYQDATKKRLTPWVSFPEGVDRSNFRLTVEMSGKIATVLMDGKIVLTTSYLEYMGGYLGLATNKATAGFKDTTIYLKTKPVEGGGDGSGEGDDDKQQKVWYTKKPTCAEITDNWKSVEGGLSSVGNAGWSKAGFGTKLANEAFIFEADIADFTGGEKQLYLYMGLTSRYYLEDGYSLRVQFGESAGNKNAAVYDDVAQKRLSAWVEWPAVVSRSDFHLKIVYEEGRLRAYVDDVLLLICDLPDFDGGYCGIATNKAGAVIKNVTVSTLRDLRNIFEEAYVKGIVEWEFLTQGWENIRRGLYSTNIGGWSKAVSTSSVKEDFFYETDVEYVSGSFRQYYFYFGLPKRDQLENGYSVRVQLDESAGKNNIAVYRDSDNKRMSAWVPFPSGSNRDAFRLGVKLSDQVAVVYIDGKLVCTTSILEGKLNGYLGLATNRTSAKLEDASLRFSAASPETGDNSRIMFYLLFAVVSLFAAGVCRKKYCDGKIAKGVENEEQNLSGATDGARKELL